jgi:hypothetical protein
VGLIDRADSEQMTTIIANLEAVTATLEAIHGL